MVVGCGIVVIVIFNIVAVVTVAMSIVGGSTRCFFINAKIYAAYCLCCYCCCSQWYRYASVWCVATKRVFNCVFIVTVALIDVIFVLLFELSLFISFVLLSCLPVSISTILVVVVLRCSISTVISMSGDGYCFCVCYHHCLCHCCYCSY